LFVPDEDPHDESRRNRGNRHEPFRGHAPPPWADLDIRSAPRHCRKKGLTTRASGRVLLDRGARIAGESAVHPRGQRFRVNALIGRRCVSVGVTLP
jgi:hypothetical protein